MKLMFNPQIIREEDESVEEFCWKLYNDFGFKTLRLSYNYIKEGEQHFSKHILFETLTFLHQHNSVPDTIDCKWEFLKKIQHRTIGDVEILIDIDDERIGEINFNTLENKADWIVMKLRQEGYSPVVYETGSKGRHISIIEPKLRNYPVLARRDYKEKFLERFGADTQKKSEGVTIALELSTHWKSGQIKKRVV